MKNLLFIFGFLIVLYSSLSAQQLPLKIGNQWHYSTVFNPFDNYAAIAVDTVIIDDKVYFKLERRKWDTGWLLTTTYDRFVGDSIYYRYNSGDEEIIINFNWQPGYIYETQLDSTCFQLKRLDYIDTSSVLGMNALRYWFSIGFYCEGFADTAWVLEPTVIHRYFGSYISGDGYLIGAIIDSTTYGVLHPLPVELASFTASVNGNDVTLNWMTASEINNQGFEIERKVLSQQSSVSNSDYDVVGFVEGKGTATEVNHYSFFDKRLTPGSFQYRIKQMDFDGSFEYYNLAETIEIGLPTEFVLEQNYPNPFNPTTVIRFQLSVNSYVTLRVYDVLGNELNTLVNEYKPAGSYEVEFDASALTSGVYFYKLQSGGLILTKKMLIIK